MPTQLRSPLVSHLLFLPFYPERSKFQEDWGSTLAFWKGTLLGPTGALAVLQSFSISFCPHCSWWVNRDSSVPSSGQRYPRRSLRVPLWLNCDCYCRNPMPLWISSLTLQGLRDCAFITSHFCTWDLTWLTLGVFPSVAPLWDVKLPRI